MSEHVPSSVPTRSAAYRLGQATAPHAARARWMWTTLTGSLDAKFAAEEVMGRHLLKAYRQAAPVDDDPGVVRRLHVVLDRLCDGIATRRRTFRVEGSLEPVANACALPGGFVLVTRPLLELCTGDDDALAFVVAHEMGHIVRCHAADRYLVSTASRAISQIIPGGHPLTAVLRDQLTQLVSQGYSREQEFEADAYGLRLSRAAGVIAAIILATVVAPGPSVAPLVRTAT